MMTKTFDCVECGASAPYGRLSCPSCGALLASVTGRKPAVHVAEVESKPEPASPSTQVAAPAAVASSLREPVVETVPKKSVAAAAPAASPARAEAPGAGTNGVKATAPPKRAPAPPPFLDADEPPEAPAPIPVAAEPPAPAPIPVAAEPPAPAPIPVAAEPPAPASIPVTAPAATPNASPVAAADARIPEAPQTAKSKPAPTTDAPEPPVPAVALPAPSTVAVPARTPTYAPTPAARARNGASTPSPTPALVAAAAATPTPAVAEPAASMTVAAEEPAPIPSAIGTAGRTPSYAPTPAASARARTSAPATTARSRAAQIEAERAAIVPLLEPSVIAALPETPWAPLEEPPPKLTARPYQRHLAFELDAARCWPTTERLPAARRRRCSWRRRRPRRTMRVAPAATTDGSAAEATMTRDATWWLNTIPDPARIVEIAGWFVVVGATMSLLGFLLPWSRVVIGASTAGGYFDGWGLASPTHLFVFIGLLAVLALAVRRRPVPAWISSGVLGLVFGGLLLGLAWPYLVGPLGADVGLTLITLGGVALLIGGVVALWATRHVEAEPLV